MAKDPICGMKVNEKEARKKGLISKKGKTVYYFCSKKCKDEFTHGKNVPWYKSQTFGNFFPYVLGVVLVVGAIWSFFGDFMLRYMGIFFIIFSLAKMLDWKGFANAFSMYDILAKNSKAYAFAYPGIEFILGILYLSGNYIVGAAIVTLFIMGVGAIGVGSKLLKKEKFVCACLGTKINLPLTKITLLEDVIMFTMAVILLI